MRIDEVAFVPHADPARWCVELNSLLSSIFPTPYSFNYSKVRRYSDARALQHKANVSLLSWINAKRVKGVLFCNLTTDFFPDILPFTRVQKVWGLVHALNRFSTNNQNKRLIDYERGLFSTADKAFVATGAVERAGLPNTTVTGLPVFSEPQPPTPHGGILFNHRLRAQKGFSRLLQLPEGLLERVVIATPSATGTELEKLKGIRKVHVSPTPDEYGRILRSCGYVISLAQAENFGYSVVDGVMAGLFAIAPKGELLSYGDLLPEEMLYEDEAEIPEIVARYDCDVEGRNLLVREAQDSLSGYAPDRWVSRLLKEMNVT